MPRQKQFDPDQALDRAVRLFWKQGYEATSIQDLVDALQINRFSLYDTFGDKQSLYEAAVERYADTVFDASLSELEHNPDGLAAIESYFSMLSERLNRKSGRKGCLIGNTIVERAPHDAALARRARAYSSRAEHAFESALVRARDAGQIRTGIDLNDRARALAITAQGILVMGKVLRDSSWAESAARVAIADLKP